MTTQRHTRRVWSLISAIAVFSVILSGAAATADTIGVSSGHHVSPLNVSQAGQDCASLQRSAGQVGTVACLTSPESLPGQAQRMEELRKQMSAPAAVVCTAKDQLFFNRTESCLFEEVAYRLIDLQTGKEVGFADMAVKSLVTLDTRTRAWTQRINATVMIAEGAAKLGTAGFATATCSNLRLSRDVM